MPMEEAMRRFLRHGAHLQAETGALEQRQQREEDGDREDDESRAGSR